MAEKYTVVRQLTTNQEVHGVYGVMIANSGAGATCELYTYGLNGVSASSKIFAAASSTDIYPIRVAGVSFGSGISVWALS